MNLNWVLKLNVFLEKNRNWKQNICCRYSRVLGHRNREIETAVWNLAGFLHCAWVRGKRRSFTPGAAARHSPSASLGAHMNSRQQINFSPKFLAKAQPGIRACWTANLTTNRMRRTWGVEISGWMKISKKRLKEFPKVEKKLKIKIKKQWKADHEKVLKKRALIIDTKFGLKIWEWSKNMA